MPNQTLAPHRHSIIVLDNFKANTLSAKLDAAAVPY